MKTQFPSQVNRYLFVSALLVALTSTGCVSGVKKMYDGPEVSPDKRAVIKISKETDGVTRMIQIDNKKTFFLLAFTTPEQVQVLPGKHNINVMVQCLLGAASSDIWLVAEAGETYVVKSKIKFDLVRIWMENERTGLPVGGIVGSSDEPK